MAQAFSVKKLVHFFFEVGTLRKTARSHRQTLLTDDLSDNIASHSYRVAVIAHFLALHEKADPYKTLAMALFHDTEETRSSDQNWIHKKYVKVYGEEILSGQEEYAQDEALLAMRLEYEKRESPEAIIAKDADHLDQILLLREYEWQGNKEAAKWLKGKRQLRMIKTPLAKLLGEEIYTQEPGAWWEKIWTEKRR